MRSVCRIAWLLITLTPLHAWAQNATISGHVSPLRAKLP